jgi:hypothetical protein
MEFPKQPPNLGVKPASVDQSFTVSDPQAVAEMLHNTMVMYGPTGTFKTSQIGQFARYIYEKTGKKTRLITADGGGYAPIQPEVNIGIIEPWRVIDEQSMNAALIAASKGAWPKKLEHGIRQPGAVTVPSRDDRKKLLADVGAFAIEGWASISSAIMRDAVDKGRKINEDVVSKFTEESDFGSFSFGAPSRGHYNYAQNFILDLIRNFSSLPVERILYTSLEGKGEDKLDKQTKYGPLVAGSAITAAIPQYVGDCLHFEDYQEEKGKDPLNEKQKLSELRVRAWFQSHPDSATGIMWPAKSRLVPGKMEAFKKRMNAPNGYFLLGNVGVGDYLRAQDEMLTLGTDDARKWKEEIDAKRKGLG